MISLRQLHYFVEIVESGGFSRAAERLFVAQSALSRQVRELEDSIGTPLPVSYTHLRVHETL
ncbi:LysR family transcriptional regulator, partial [Pseudomonas aeruginosa]